jgi:hypothetical protein
LPSVKESSLKLFPTRRIIYLYLGLCVLYSSQGLLSSPIGKGDLPGLATTTSVTLLWPRFRSEDSRVHNLVFYPVHVVKLLLHSTQGERSTFTSDQILSICLCVFASGVTGILPRIINSATRGLEFSFSYLFLPGHFVYPGMWVRLMPNTLSTLPVGPSKHRTVWGARFWIVQLWAVRE